MRQYLVSERSQIENRIAAKELALHDLRMKPHFYGQATFINCTEAELSVLRMRRRVIDERLQIAESHS